MPYQPLAIFDNLLHCQSQQQLELKDQAWFKAFKASSWQKALTQDHYHANRFLQSYNGNEATYNSYRREVERLLHWSWAIEQKPIIELDRAAIEKFFHFCQKPPVKWIASQHFPRFIDKDGQRFANNNWRPFVATISKTAAKKGLSVDIEHYQLSEKALQSIFSVLSSFFNYLIAEDYSKYNPVAQIRQKSKFLRKRQNKQVIRRLSELQWSYVIETAELMAKENPALHERTLFIMNALFGMYLRISELVASDRWQPQMGHFFQDHDGHWWFTTVGKGNKQRDISVSDAMLKAFKRYRQSLILPPLPPPGDANPLIPKFRGQGPVNSTRQIRKLVQLCFDNTTEHLIADGFQDEAEQLMAATVHWLRHTGISEDVKTRPREHVRDDAGHGSSAITDKYIDIEKRARAQSAKTKMINPNE